MPIANLPERVFYTTDEMALLLSLKENGMPVAEDMRFTRGVIRPVFVLVVRVMDVPVFVLYRFVMMLMLVPLDKMEIESDARQEGGNAKPRTDGL